MQPDDLEKAFRQKMKSHAPAWDKAKNWGAIEARLPQPRKRRPVWLFWLFGAAVAGSVIWWGMAEGNETNPEKTTFSVAETVENQPIAKQNDLGKNLTESILPKEKNTDEAALTTAALATEPLVFDKKTKVKNGQTEAVAKDTIAQFFDEKTTGTQAILGKKLPLENTNETAAITPFRQAENLEKLPFETHPLALPQAENDLATSIAQRTEVLKNKPRFGVEIYGGVGQPLRRFSAVSPEKQAYVSERQQRETVLESIEAGVLLSARFRNGWSLATGLESQKINEKFSWQNLTTETVNVYSDSAYFYYDDLNERQFIGDTVLATLTQSRQVTNFNKQTFLNVPLLVGFEKRFPNFSLRATGGAVLNFYRGFEGIIFDENAALISGDDLRQNGIYHNKTGLSLQAGLDISRTVGRWGEVFAGIQYRHGLTSLTGAAAGYEQRFGSLGGTLGWRFFLFVNQ